MLRHNLMIVDDEPIVRSSLSDWLKEEGFSVLTAEDGVRALEIIGKEKVDCVILDLKMPGMDGIQVLKEIKARNPEAKVIMITAYGTIQNAVEAMKIGANDYITKPFAPEDIIESIKRALTLSESRFEIVQEVMTEEKAVSEEALKKIADTHVMKALNLYREGMYDEAIIELKNALKVFPNYEEVKRYIRKIERERDYMKPAVVVREKAVKADTEQTGEKECIWSKMGIISYRICTTGQDCSRCEFAQNLQEAESQYQDRIGFASIKNSLLALPASGRKCRYMLSGDVEYKICPRLYQCGTCVYDQMMQDMIQDKAERALSKIKTKASKNQN
ncbi:MAG: response regulator [Candidatus Aminicenantia bacterium]